ncbi:MAG TPA: DUF4476 domain-containing protein, partial [Clostridia bacterium]|nr:DUF4476 domain-containing protein [Clostridia bacterium]
QAGEQETLSANRFQESIQGMTAERQPGEKLRRAKDISSRHWLSSLQVKEIALRLPDDTARLEFATAAYYRTVDPENFYEVYDAFTSFSKVMRLHDRIRPTNHHPAPPVVVVPPTVTPGEMKDILKALRKEAFEQTRIQIARQIISGHQRNFLASQVKQMLDCFDYEHSKLEMAKFAYDYTFDKEKYFLVNEAFDFDASKDQLARYIESRKQQASQAQPRLER